MSGFPQISSTCFYLALFYLTAISEAVPVHHERSDARFHSDRDLGSQHVFGTDFPWLSYVCAILGAVVSVSLSVFLCTCCVRRPRDPARETRGGTQLSNITSEDRNSGEITLFPPPSLVLSHEDLNVRFEPLPAGPQKNSLFHTYRPKELEEWLDSGFGLFPRSDIQYLREIGRGWFGQVLEAEIKGLDSPQSVSRCAVKILRPEANTLHQAKFVKEVEPLRLINHTNVLRLLGCCLECPPLLVLLQHCPNGDLKLFLHSYQMTNCRNPLPENVLLRFACEAAQGLLCWHQAGLVHEDVAARSFMLTSDLTVVLGSYGLTLNTHEDEFVNVGQNSLPIRWIAPELYNPLAPEVVHTEASNIWSFGVVLWEIICLGSRPYTTLSDEEVVRQVLQEKRTILTAPSGQLRTEQVLYQLMLQCWDIDVSLRPSMKEIVSRLTAASVTVSRDLENDFELKWNSARTNQVSHSPTASLNNLHGSFEDLTRGRRVSVASENDDTENGFSAKVSAALRSLDEALAAAGGGEDGQLPLPKFQLGQTNSQQDSVDSSSSSPGSSLASSKSWQERMSGGELEALVREKSRSIQDLMVLTHVEPLSDVEFLLRDPDKGKEAKNSLPEIKVTSSSGEVDSCEAGNPQLDSPGNPQTTPQTHYPRLRLTSTPCSDDEDDRRISPSSHERLEASSLQQAGLPQYDQEESSVILGPSEDLGLDFYQALTTTQRDRDFVLAHDDNQEDEESSKEDVNIQVNIEAWDRFLDEVCEQQQPHFHPLNGSEEALSGPLLRDSGIARASFNGSDDILGSTFNNSSNDRLKSPDDKVPQAGDGVADIVNGTAKLALKLPLDEKEVDVGTQSWPDHTNSTTNESRKHRDERGTNSSQDVNAEDLETSRSSQDTPFDTYFSYGTIDEDIRSAMSRETDESPCTLGKEILAGLQMKSRTQRQANQSESSSDSGSEGDDEDDVLVVDLETKRAVLVEAQSPKLKSALANEDFDTIFNTSPVENRRRSIPEKASEAYTPDFESDSETDDEDDSDDETEEGTEQSNFVWQAAYCRKLQPSLSMEIIEEECEDEEEDTGTCEAVFIPSTWRKEATPTRSALKSPEKSSPRKNVSWMRPGRHVYSYTVDNNEDSSSASSVTSPRRKWNVSPSNEATYASFADWDFGVDDENVEPNQQRAESDFMEDIPRVRPKPKDLNSGALFYRLSDIDNGSDEEDEFYVDEKQDPLWIKGMEFSQFQPSQYFPPWDKTAEDGSNSSSTVPTEPTTSSVTLDLPDFDSQA